MIENIYFKKNTGLRIVSFCAFILTIYKIYALTVVSIGSLFLLFISAFSFFFMFFNLPQRMYAIRKYRENLATYTSVDIYSAIAGNKNSYESKVEMKNYLEEIIPKYTMKENERK